MILDTNFENLKFPGMIPILQNSDKRVSEKEFSVCDISTGGSR